MSDLHGRGGVHGARHLYTQKDIGTGRIDVYPTSKQDNKQTIAAMAHIIGNLPRRSYYSDNQKCLVNGARACGMTTECSLQGVSQTNAIADANNKTILSGIRKLLCQARLPAVWWTLAAGCFCFLKNALPDAENDSAYFRTHGSRFPGKMIPFGCHVFFIPSPTKDTRAKTAPRLRQGNFLGYRTAPGGEVDRRLPCSRLKRLRWIAFAHQRRTGNVQKCETTCDKNREFDSRRSHLSVIREANRA